MLLAKKFLIAKWVEEHKEQLQWHDNDHTGGLTAKKKHKDGFIAFRINGGEFSHAQLTIFDGTQSITIYDPQPQANAPISKLARYIRNEVLHRPPIEKTEQQELEESLKQKLYSILSYASKQCSERHRQYDFEERQNMILKKFLDRLNSDENL